MEVQRTVPDMYNQSIRYHLTSINVLNTNKFVETKDPNI